MKINRTALLDAVNAALDEHRARYDAAWTTWHDAVVAERARWVTEYSQAWRDSAQTIMALVDNGKPVTRGHLPTTSTYRTDIVTWSEPTQSLERPDHSRVRRPDDVYSAPSELLGLRSALEMITDDEVGHSALLLVVSGSTLRDALRIMGRVREAEEVTS